MEEQAKETVVSEEEASTTVDEASSKEEAKVEESTEETVNVAEMTALKEENDKLQDRLLRVQAEFENYKRRTEKERIAERKYQSQDFATDLLPVLDNFERALQVEIAEENKGLIDGIKMVYSQLQDALEKQEVTVIETENAPFDPNYHHAVMQVEDEELASNTVVEELQKGYLLKDKVIRPAMVKVNM